MLLGGIAGGAGYLYYTSVGEQYRTVFFPHTVVNGVDASQKTVDEVEQLVSSRMEEDYELTVVGRGGVTETITGKEIGMHYKFDDSLDQYLAAQNPMDWWSYRSTAVEYKVDVKAVPDEELLADRIDRLVFLDDDKMVEPKNASLSEYIEGEGYQVLPEDGVGVGGSGRLQEGCRHIRRSEPDGDRRQAEPLSDRNGHLSVRRRAGDPGQGYDLRLDLSGGGRFDSGRRGTGRGVCEWAGGPVRHAGQAEDAEDYRRRRRDHHRRNLRLEH